ncbi:complement C1q-like protein 2 [Eucyclogobius newberryi]|uniref:complement C1q-like protein 2 n=1 Tax=Eucyclogobius newberryi TaxID=166745 RepID=UPI003B5B2413
MQTAVLLLLLGCAASELLVNPNKADNHWVDGSVAMAVGALTEKVANLVDKMTQVEARLDNAERELTQLKSITRGTPKVAFSATLLESGSGNTGPFNIDTPLKYKKVFSNFGNNYNPATGIFTATIKGVFYFRFSMFNNLSSPNSVVSLKKNGERVVSVWDTDKSDGNDMGSNAAVLPLETGDTVYVELLANRLVYDDGMNYNTFAGFLLFTHES